MAALLLASPPVARARQTPAQRAQHVVAFFDHHRKAAVTPAGQRILWRAIHTLTTTVRSLQAVPSTWLDSVTYTGRYFGADVAEWERSCSAQGSEGGWGSWVPNSLGSGAGGWLQFMSGTFYGIIDRGIADAKARGMPVPSSARSWYSPLGQAIAGAQMLLDGRRGEWTGSGC